MQFIFLQIVLRWIIFICDFTYGGTPDSQGYYTYCENYWVKLYCASTGPYKIVDVEDAIYGSTNTAKCGTVDTACTVPNVSSQVQSACAGKSSCVMNIKSSLFGNECGSGSNNSLRVKFRCIDGPSSQHDLILDGWWTTWSAWSQCSATCGDGVWNRSRTCSDPAPQNNGTDCSGTTSTSSSCTLQTCEATNSSSCCSACPDKNNATLTSRELEEKLEDIKTNLFVNKRELSSTVRRKTSATDNRPTSVAMGTVAVVFLSLFTLGVIGMDSRRLYTGTKRFFTSTAKYLLRRKTFRPLK